MSSYPMRPIGRKSLANLTKAIERDLLAERPRAAPTPECFACSRACTPKPPTGDDSTRFCSDRCREVFDAGLFRNVDLPAAADWIGVDTSRMVQAAGPPIQRCDRCGGLCVEMYRKQGGTFCHWRCRDDKPRDCEACGANPYGIARRGPYCSVQCANARGLKTRRRVSDEKTENSVQKTPVEPALVGGGRRGDGGSSS
jgi:hypothetical protein